MKTAFCGTIKRVKHRFLMPEKAGPFFRCFRVKNDPAGYEKGEIMNKKMCGKRSTSLFLICSVFACMLLSSAGCQKKIENTVSDSLDQQKTIEEMVVDYASYGTQADDTVDALLKELSSADPAAGIRWTKIMDLWRSPELGQPLNYDVLPDGLPDTDELCIVVLGFQLNPDGSMKDELIERLTVALNSAEKYPNAYIVCTGGGTAEENESATEAGEMAKWLEENGIDKNRIIVENHSITTAQNAIFTYDILTSLYPSVKSLAIVSSDYHIEPSILFFEAVSILRGAEGTDKELKVVSNACWKAPEQTLSVLFRAGGLIEITGDETTAKKIYNRTYDFESVSPF